MSRPKSKTAEISFEPLYKDSLRDRAVEVIRRHMAEAGLQPGATLPTERDLSKGLAVSRTVVREALAILEAEGLVERKPSSGYFVGTAVPDLHLNSSAEIHRLLNETAEVRLSFELGAAYLIVPRLTLENVAELEREARLLDLAMDQQQAHAQAEIAFHQSVWAVAQNSSLIEVGQQVLGNYFRALALARPDCFVNPVDVGASRHLPIIEALCTFDITAVQTAMREHCRLPTALRGG
jgi:DNA-binding FadR family transcriptional regulator